MSTNTTTPTVAGTRSPADTKAAEKAISGLMRQFRVVIDEVGGTRLISNRDQFSRAAQLLHAAWNLVATARDVVNGDEDLAALDFERAQQSLSLYTPAK